MTLTAFAIQYVTRHRLRGKTPIYSARRFERLVGTRLPEQVTRADVDTYRSACVAAELSPKTTESSIGNIQTLVRAATGRELAAGRRLQVARPVPSPVALDVISATWAHSPDWLRQLIAVGFWAGMRLGDLLRVQLDLSGPVDVLRWRAGKTSTVHVCPVPDWLRSWLRPLSPPWRCVSDHARRSVRRQIASACAAGSVDLWTPKQLRQRSITEWSRSNATAGSIIHGSGLGVLAHYVDPLSVLDAAAGTVRLPDCFGAGDTGPDVVAMLRRLDPEARDLVIRTARRLA